MQRTSAYECEDATRPSIERQALQNPTIGADDIVLRKEDRRIPLVQVPVVNRLNSNESFLLSHYIQRFSRTYPTCSDPTNPFLSILLPLAMENRTVLDAVLALSGAQFGTDHSSRITRATLEFRHRALEGCRNLLAQSEFIIDPNIQETERDAMRTSGDHSILFTLACCICLLLYEKLVGDGKANWMPHLVFLAGLFDRLESPANRKTLRSILCGDQQRQTFQFLHNLFLYNDLVQSTAIGASTFSNYYIRKSRPDDVSDTSLSVGEVFQMTSEQLGDMYKQGRFYFPYLVARISAEDDTVSDACIDAWDGRLDWLPSFSITLQLSKSTMSQSMPSENMSMEGGDANLITQNTDLGQKLLISIIYSCAAKVYLRKRVCRREGHSATSQSGLEMAHLACHAAFLISQMRDGSSFENTLLWPIGIIGPELSAVHAAERHDLLCRLQKLERRFQMKHFDRMQEVLVKSWDRIDRVVPGEKIQDDVFLFG